MVSTKRSTSFHLSPDAHRLLAALSARLGISKTSALELAIRLLAKEQGVAIETTAETKAD